MDLVRQTAMGFFFGCGLVLAFAVMRALFGLHIGIGL